MSGAFPNGSSSYFMKQTLSLNLKLSTLVRLDGHCASGVFLSPLLQCWDYSFMLRHSALKGVQTLDAGPRVCMVSDFLTKLPLHPDSLFPMPSCRGPSLAITDF